MWTKTKSLLKRFRSSRDGNMAIIGALLGVPVLIGAIGISVDYSMGANNRTSMQNALDSAVWQTAKLDPELTQTAKAAQLQKFYAANGGLGTAKIDSMNTTATHVILAASASYDMKTSAMGVAGMKSVRIATQSAAQLPFKLTSASFSVTKQSGWWGKSIYVYGRETGATQYKPLGRIMYGGMTSASNSAMRANKLYKYIAGLPVEVNDMTIDLANIDSMYISMVIDGASETAIDGLIRKAFGLTDYDTVVMPKLIESDDPDFVGRMFITKNGTVTQNTRTDIYTRLGCGETETHSWEDGGSLQRNTVDNGGTYQVTKNGKTTTEKKKTSTVLEGRYSTADVPANDPNPVAKKASLTDFQYTITGRCTYTTGGAYLTQ